jgi:hypothetical protein
MRKKIQFFALVLIIPFIFSSCRPTLKNIEKFGTLSIASTKNLNVNGDYILLARSAGFDESQIATVRKKGATVRHGKM